MTLWLVAAAVFLLDRWTKSLIGAHFFPGESAIVVPHVLWWTYVQNTHGAFGLFGSQPVLLIGLALAVLVLFAYAFRDAVRSSLLVRIAFGAIVGGAAGNIVDRLQHHYVVDFIDFKTIWPNVFNAADSCITIGVIVLILASMRTERKRPRAAQP
ncbi:MAG TPA: signal peptidase II [Candidatus Lustribacter sp.]